MPGLWCTVVLEVIWTWGQGGAELREGCAEAGENSWQRLRPADWDSFPPGGRKASVTLEMLPRGPVTWGAGAAGATVSLSCLPERGAVWRRAAGAAVARET